MLELGFLYQYLSSYATPVWATVIAGFFVAVSLCLSTYLIIEHLSAYNNPEVWFFFFPLSNSYTYINGGLLYQLICPVWSRKVLQY